MYEVRVFRWVCLCLAPEATLPGMRICSLLPSATETLYALGIGDSVVGITHECDYPPEAAEKPVLIRPRVDPAASPAEVDEQVRELIGRGESIYGVDDELLRRLQPDLIITQDLCHVCAASPDDLATALTRLEKMPRVLSLTPHTIADVWDDIRRIGDATGHAAEAEALVTALKRRVSDVEKAVSSASERPKVVCLEWLDPAYVGGHWVPQMVARAGGVDAQGCPGEPSFRVPWSRVLEARPEVIVVMPCGYNLARTVEEFNKIKLPAGWAELPAVRDHRVFAVDANSYFSRPSPRLADGVALLAHLFHPLLATQGVPAHAARELC
jgi:iron complex transport system substrate-binding protein